MLLWITRWLAASLNVAFCGFMAYALIDSAKYFRVEEKLAFGQYAGWIGGLFIVMSTLAAAWGFLSPRLLSFGLRWHSIAALGGLLFGVVACLHDIISTILLCGERPTYVPWYYLYIATGFALIWGGVWAVVRGLVARAH